MYQGIKMTINSDMEKKRPFFCDVKQTTTKGMSSSAINKDMSNISKGFVAPKSTFDASTFMKNNLSQIAMRSQVDQKRQTKKFQNKIGQFEVNGEINV